MSLPLIMYGAKDCEDTEHVRRRLNEWGIPFQEINIDQDKEAEQFVMFINTGYRSTPTMVINAGKIKIIATEPTDETLKQLLVEAGYSI
mgnify:CR=1 FL=1